ncbi:branched-chain amino acid ABC transporter substrate-binding protein [Nocardioides hungaricus]
MRTSKIKFVALLASAAFALAACGGSSDDGGSDSGATITLGAQAPTTGPAASIGQVWQKGMELAVEQVNSNGGIEVDGKTYEFELDFQDNKTDPKTAIGISQEFLNNGYKFLVGPSVGTIFAPVWETMSGRDALTITAATVAPTLVGTDEGKYLFPTQQPVSGPTGSIAGNVKSVIEKWNPESVALLEPADPSGEEHVNAYTEAFESAGVDIVYSDNFVATTQDFSPYITKMKDANPDLVVFGYLDSLATPFLKQAGEAQFNPKFAFAPGVSAAVVEGLDVDASFTIPTRAIDNLEDTSLDGVRDAYKDEFGEDVGPGDFYIFSYYDAIRTLARAIEIAGTTTDLEAISEAMSDEKASDYPNRGLDIKWDSGHNVTFPPQTQFVIDGQSSYVDDAS